MKQKRFFCLLLGLCSLMWCHAWEYASEDVSVSQSLQLRTGADFTKNFDKGIRLRIGEELRFNLFNSLTGPSFDRSYTTLTFFYSPLSWLKTDVGYTMKIMGTNDWSDVDKWLRHRLFFSATGSCKFASWQLSLRERAVLDMRADSLNPLAKNRFDWLLASRLTLEYECQTMPLKPYLWVELLNTLNVPEYQRKDGMQYIRYARTAAGLTWRVNSRNALNFYYRFDYGYDRDVSVENTTGNIMLTEKSSFQHIIGINYEFDW